MTQTNNYKHCDSILTNIFLFLNKEMPKKKKFFFLSCIITIDENKGWEGYQHHWNYVAISQTTLLGTEERKRRHKSWRVPPTNFHSL